MKLKIPTLMLAMALGAATGAQAAERIVLASLGDVNGKVMINQGRGFVAARAGMDVSVGDRLIALEGASAQVVYKDGCVTQLKERNLLPVDAKGCATQPLNPSVEAVKLAQAIGAGDPKPDTSPTDKPLPAPEPVAAAGMPTGLIAGAAVLGLAAMGAGGGGGDSTPISQR
jgi:hypothetical protein